MRRRRVEEGLSSPTSLPAVRCRTKTLPPPSTRARFLPLPCSASSVDCSARRSCTRPPPWSG